ncbi:MAG: DMT family protein [Terracidiphilus sp.]
MSTIILLIFSNCFMTFAWYGHLKYGHSWPLWKAILVSWGIALFEYCLAVPANRLGYGEFSGFQLKIIQEVVTLTCLQGAGSDNLSSSRFAPRLERPRP